MNIEDMCKEWLQTHDGYDGLCNAEIECGCHVDNLMPCLEPDIRECVAGYKVEVSESEFDYLVYEGKKPE